jgi:hypothetical protein
VNHYAHWSHEDWLRHYAEPRFHPPAEGAGGLISDTRLLFPWNKDIPEAKLRVDAKFKALIADVDACQTVTPAERQAFHSQYDVWRQYFCGGSKPCTEPSWSVFGLGSQMDEIEKWEVRAHDWQERFQGRCALSAPTVRPVPLADRAREGGASTESLVKYGAIAVAAVAAAYLLGPAARGLGSRISKKDE